MSLFNKRTLLLLTLLSPSVAFAAIPVGFDGLDNLIKSFASGVVQSTGYMMLTLAVVAFFFGIVQFIWSARQGSEGKGITKGKQFILWGLIGIFVMFSVWGIIQFAQGVLGIQGYNTITVPDLRFRSGGAGSVNGTSGLGGGTYTTTQNSASQAYTNCIKSGKTVAQCENQYQSSGGTGGAYTATQTGAQNAYNTCIGNGGTAASCQTQYQAAGGQGSGTQNLAQQAYNECIGNGNSATECQGAYVAYQGTGSGQQNLAQQAYNTCIGNGNSASECQGAYSAYGGTGSGAANLGQQAYDMCISNGGSNSQCTAARDAYAGSSAPDNSDVGGGWNPGSGGSTSPHPGTTTCGGKSITNPTEAEFQAFMNSCDPSAGGSSSGGTTAGTIEDCYAQGKTPLTNSAGAFFGCSSGSATDEEWRNTGNGYDNDTAGGGTQTAGGDWGATTDPVTYDDWQTSGNGFDTGGSSGGDSGLQVTESGDIEYNCTDYCG